MAINLLQVAAAKVKNLANQYINNVAKPMAVGVPQAQNFINNSVASAPYAVANMKMKLSRPQMVPDMNSNYFKKMIAEDKEFEEAPPMQKLFIMQENPFQQTYAESARKTIRPQGAFMPAPQVQSDPYLEGIKQKVLSGANIRPAAKEYLSGIPVTFGSPEEGEAWGGVSKAKGTRSREITINKNMVEQEKDQTRQPVQEEIERIVKHELLHQTPRLVPMELFSPQNEPVISEYTQRWGKDYMKRPRALVEEMFAEEALPPAYYWHIFKKVNPKAKEEDFVGILKSYFVNAINTPESISGGRGYSSDILGAGMSKATYGKRIK